MGASGHVAKDSILLSFSKIENLAFNIKFKNENELTKILYSLIKGDEEEQELNQESRAEKEKSRINSCLDKFNDLITKNHSANIDSILKFILLNLHKELKENENEEILENVRNNCTDLSEYEYYDNKFNNSLIQKLFFGIKEKITLCKNCRYQSHSFENFEFQKYDLRNLNKNLNDKIQIYNLFEESQRIEKKIYCQNCKSETSHIIQRKIVKFPKIFIMYINFDQLENKNIDFTYYLYLDILYHPYKLICSIANTDENGNRISNYNILYLENGKWYIYKIKENQKLLITNNKIESINVNPLVVFYQKTKDPLFEKYYKLLTLLLEDESKIIEAVNGHLIPEIKDENYYLVDANWYNKIKKIFENNEQYNDNSFKINSIKNRTNILKLHEEKYIEIYKLFKERERLFKDKNLFKIDFKEVNDIKYPNNFFIVKENLLNEILNLFGNNYRKKSYKIKFGENYAFIKDNEIENERIFVCNLNKNLFNTIIIFSYNNFQFNRELSKYISNRGGLEYYYQIRKLSIEDLEEQKIIDYEKEKIGFAKNVINLKDHMNKYKLNTYNYYDNPKNSMVSDIQIK